MLQKSKFHCEYLVGTANSIDQAIAAFELDCSVEDVESFVEDGGIELCSVCGWWDWADEMVDDGDQFLCQDCAEDEQ